MKENNVYVRMKKSLFTLVKIVTFNLQVIVCIQVRKKFHSTINKIMEPEDIDYDDYLQMLEQEENDDEIRKLLEEKYGDSGSEYEPNVEELSDDMEIIEVGKKRKRPNVKRRAKRVCKSIQNTDSNASTSTTDSQLMGSSENSEQNSFSERVIG